MTKYKKQFQTMLSENHALFIDFKTVHDRFAAGEIGLKNEFDEKGQKILRVIRRYEDALCVKSENSGYGQFSENLSEKFWEEVRIYLPDIGKVTLL
jgi:hypothetical protein